MAKYDAIVPLKKGILSDVYVLKFPNFFILPQYTCVFANSSPSFDFSNETWCFKCQYCRSDETLYIGIRRLNSGKKQQKVLCEVFLLDAYDKEYDHFFKQCNFKENMDNISFRPFTNDKPSFDTRDVLTVIVHVVSEEAIKVNKNEALRIEDFPDKMAEKAQHCKISLKSSKKALTCYDIYYKIKNIFTVPIEIIPFRKESIPSFEFDKATWGISIRVDTKLEDKTFYVYLIRLNSVKSEHNVIIGITLLDGNDIKCDFDVNFYQFGYCSERRVFSFDSKKHSGIQGDHLHVVLHLIPHESIEVATSSELLITDREFSLLWREYKNLLLTGKRSDLVLRVADKEFKVHRNILMARSEVFKDQLSEDGTVNNKQVIDIPDCDPEAMEQFLMYVYCGKVEILNSENVFGLYHLSDKYNMRFLREDCTKLMRKLLSPSIFSDFYQLLLNHTNIPLLECATEYFVNHSSLILSTKGWIRFMELNSVAANELLKKVSEK